MFFLFDSVDMASYADDKTSHTSNHYEIENILK